MSRSFSRANTVGSAGSSGCTRSGRSSRKRSKSSLTVVSRSASAVRADSPRPVEARTHGTDRDVERGGDLVVAELLPHVQEQHVAFSFGQRAPTASAMCGHSSGASRRATTVRSGRPAGSLAREETRGRVRCGAPRCAGGGRAGWSRCRRATAARSAGRSRRSRASRTRRGTRRRAALGFVDAHPAHEIPEEHGRVAVEERAEARGLVERRRDHLGVRLGVHHEFAAAGLRFAAISLRRSVSVTGGWRRRPGSPGRSSPGSRRRRVGRDGSLPPVARSSPLTSRPSRRTARARPGSRPRRVGLEVVVPDRVLGRAAHRATSAYSPSCSTRISGGLADLAGLVAPRRHDDHGQPGVAQRVGLAGRRIRS